MGTRASYGQLNWRGRVGVLVFIAAGHAAALMGMSQWTGSRPPLDVLALQVQLLPEETPQPRELPPPPSPVIELPVIEVTKPEVAIDWVPDPAPLRVALASLSPPTGATVGEMPQLVSHVDYAVPPRPVYPAGARKRREQGLVIVKVLVDINGAAAAVEVHQSSGYPLLDGAAREAARRARFHPYRENGVARAVFVLLPIEFGLNARRAHS